VLEYSEPTTRLIGAERIQMENNACHKYLHICSTVIETRQQVENASMPATSESINVNLEVSFEHQYRLNNAIPLASHHFGVAGPCKARALAPLAVVGGRHVIVAHSSGEPARAAPRARNV